MSGRPRLSGVFMNRTAANAVIMVLTTVLAKLLGFARELSLAFAYGADMVSDAYVVAFSLPNILFSGIGTAMLTSYISVYTDLETNRPGQKREFHNHVMTLSFCLSVFFIGGFLLLRRPIIRLFALGFRGESFELAVDLGSLMIFSLLFMGVSYILQGFLQMKGKFLAVGMVSVPLNIAIISTILMSRSNRALLGWGVVAGYAGEFALVLLVACRSGFSYHPELRFRNENARKFARMVLPIFLGKAVYAVNSLIDKTIASLLPSGVVSVMNYGSRVTGFVISVFVVAVTTALFPKFSKLSAEEDVRQLKRTYNRSMGIIALFVIPVSTGLMMFSREIVSLLFERGAFTAQDAGMTGEVVFFYAAGLLFHSLKDVTVNVYYALQDPKTPTLNSLLAIGINVILNLLLMKRMAHRGLALATSVSGLVTLLLLLRSLRKKMGRLGYGHLARTMLKMTAAAGVMAAGTLPLHAVFLRKTAALPALLLSVPAGALIYFAACLLFRIREFGLVLTAVLRRSERKNV